MLDEEPLLYYQPILAEEQPRVHSAAFSCVATFAGELKKQANALQGIHAKIPGVVSANHALDQYIKEYDDQLLKAGDVHTALCKAHLDFIKNVLYDHILLTMITNPMYLFNRGGNAADYRFTIYQYSSHYNDERVEGRINQRRLHEKTTSYDGHYIMLPDLKLLVEQFYKDINALALNIESDDPHTPDGLIKKWVRENDIDAIVNPPAVVEETPNPLYVFPVLPAPSPNPTIDEFDMPSYVYSRYAAIVIIGSILGLFVGLFTTDQVGLTRDVIYQVDGEPVNAGTEPTTMGWVYTASVMLGVSTLFSALYAFARSKKTLLEMAGDWVEAVTPTAATMSVFASGWHMMVPAEFHYPGADDDQHSNHHRL